MVLFDDDGVCVGFVVVIQDLSVQFEVTERWRAAHVRAVVLLEHWWGVVLVVDFDGVVSYVMLVLVGFVGVVVDLFVGWPFWLLLCSIDVERVDVVFWVFDVLYWQIMVEVCFVGDDFDAWWDVQLELINCIDDLYIGGIVVNVYEVQDLVEIGGYLCWEVEYDLFIGLFNWVYLLACLRVFDLVDGDLSAVALLVIDLDNFKLLNDAMGYYVGDYLFMELVARFFMLVCIGDIVVCFGGDEFGIFVVGLLWFGQVEELVEWVCVGIVELVELFDGWVMVIVLVGLVFGSDSYYVELFQVVDMVFYLVKERGWDWVEVFILDLLTKVYWWIETEQLLCQVLDVGEMIVYYQLVVDLVMQRVVSVEVLLCIRDVEGRVYLFISLIAVVEEIGLIVLIGLLVIADACRQLIEWRRELGDLVFVCVVVNLLLWQLVLKGLVYLVERILREHGVEFVVLCLEIIESSVILVDDVVVGNVCVFYEIGVLLVIDDFGMGYFGFLYLICFLVLGVKIDWVFVMDLVHDYSVGVIVGVVVLMVMSFGFYLVVEGVEIAEQFEVL